MEQLTFAEALFADLISLHPVLCSLPPVLHARDANYDAAIGKAVMVTWFNIRKEINSKLRNDYLKYIETQDSFKKYLVEIASFALSSVDEIHGKVLVLSALLLEVISFLYRRGMTNFVYYAPHYWLHVFQLIDSAEFYRKGGWRTVELTAMKQAEIYDKMKDLIQLECWSENFGIAPRSAPLGISKNLHPEDSTETTSGKFAEESPSNEKTEETPQEVTVSEGKASHGCEIYKRNKKSFSRQFSDRHNTAFCTTMLERVSNSDTEDELSTTTHQSEEKSRRSEEGTYLPGEIVAHHDQLSQRKDLISGFSEDATRVVCEKSSSTTERKCLDEGNKNEVQSRQEQSSSDDDVTKEQPVAGNYSRNEQSSEKKEIAGEVSEKSSEGIEFDHPEQKLPEINDSQVEVVQTGNEQNLKENHQSTAERISFSQKTVKELKVLFCSYDQISTKRKVICDNALGKSKEMGSNTYENQNEEKKSSVGEIIEAAEGEVDRAEQSLIKRYTGEASTRSHDINLESEEVSTSQMNNFKEAVTNFETTTGERATDETQSPETVIDGSEQHMPPTENPENFGICENEFKILIKVTEPSVCESQENEQGQTSNAETLEMGSEEDHEIRNITVRSKTCKTPYKEEETPSKSRPQNKSAENTPRLSNVNSSSKKVTPKPKAVTPKMSKSEASPAVHITPTDREHFSKCQMNATDEKNRRLSLPKGLSERSKPSRRTSSAKAKPGSKADENNELLCPGSGGEQKSKETNQENPDLKKDKNSKRFQCVVSRMQSSSKQSSVQGKSANPAATTPGGPYVKGSRKQDKPHCEKSAQSSSESVESVKASSATSGQINPRKIPPKDTKNDKPRWR